MFKVNNKDAIREKYDVPENNSPMNIGTAQKMEFSIKDFFRKCDQMQI